MIFLIGGSGRLGQALVRQFGAGAVQCLPRPLYAGWHADTAAADVARYFSAAGAGPGDIIYVAAGLLDPRLPEQEHAAVNLELPRNIIDGAAPLGIAVRTFGTVMETLLSGSNAYIRSKTALGALVEQRAANGLPVAHVRIHTQYGGGAPSAFMFLGQIAAALREKTTFAMTAGAQLREYHHVDDDAAALRLLEEAGLHGIVALSHAAPVTLRALAEHVFAAFGASDQLAVGALPEPPAENYSGVLARPPALAAFVFRPALAGVVDYLKHELPFPVFP